MESCVEFFWVEFLLFCLPNAIKDFYINKDNQTKYKFQTFEEGNTFWVRQSVTKNKFGEFNLSVFCENWINLPYALHQEWNEEYKGPDQKKLIYLQIGNYRVCKNAIKHSDVLVLRDKSYYMNKTDFIDKNDDYLFPETYHIGLKG